MSVLRAEVLSIYKKLFRTCAVVFKGDDRVHPLVQEKIREEFRKHINETDEEKIKELITMAEEAEVEIRTNVVRFDPVGDDEENRYKAVIREDILHDNPKLLSQEEIAEALAKEDAELEERRRKRKERMANRTKSDDTNDDCCQR